MDYNKGYSIPNRRIITSDKVKTFERNVLRNVYIWMAIGLTITASLAYLIAKTPALNQPLLQNMRVVSLVSLVAFIGMIFGLQAKIETMSPLTSIIIYLAFVSLQGVLLFSIFLVYPSYLIVKTFFVTAAAFAGLSLYAIFTKRSLTGMRPFLVMTTIGLVVALVVNMFLKSSGFDMVISMIGVLLFSAWTAYDTQKIAQYSRQVGADIDEPSYIKYSILGALQLYLDFINLFLYLLSIFSRRD